MPPVASNLQITTNYSPAVNARGRDPLMAEQENGSSPLAEALARVGDREREGLLIARPYSERPPPSQRSSSR